MDTLEQFLVNNVQSIKHNLQGGRNSRFDLFARKQRAYDAIHTTQFALKAHVKLFQAGPNVWVQSNVTEQQLSSTSNCGLAKQTNV